MARASDGATGPVIGKPARERQREIRGRGSGKAAQARRAPQVWTTSDTVLARCSRGTEAGVVAGPPDADRVVAGRGLRADGDVVVSGAGAISIFAEAVRAVHSAAKRFFTREPACRMTETDPRGPKPDTAALIQELFRDEPHEPPAAPESTPVGVLVPQDEAAAAVDAPALRARGRARDAGRRGRDPPDVDGVGGGARGRAVPAGT